MEMGLSSYKKKICIEHIFRIKINPKNSRKYFNPKKYMLKIPKIPKKSWGYFETRGVQIK